MTDRRLAVPGWGVLLLAAQWAALLLTDAGPRVAYQHYRLPSTPWQYGALAVLVLQALLVMRRGGPLLWGAARWVRERLSLPAWGALLLLVFGTGAVASKSPVAWLLELLVAAAVQGVALGNVLLLAQATRGNAGERLLAGAGTPWRDGLVWGASVAVLVLSSLLAVFVYQDHPHVPDEVTYLLQARYFASGKLWMTAPPAPLAFNLDLMHYEATRWYTPTPPGWPAVLALGVRAGVPWLVNPLLGALNVLLAHRVLYSMYDRRVARLGAVLLAASPWHLFLSMSFMTHQVVLCLGLLGAVAVARVRDARLAGDGRVPAGVQLGMVLGGLAIGGASLVRPLEGLAIALLLGFWSLPPRWWTTLRSIPAFVPSALLALGAILGGVLVRPYNRLMTGDPSYFPIMAYIDKYYTPGANDLGFGASRGLGWSGLDPFPGHGLRDVVVNAALNAAAVNVEWLGWATGSVLVLALALVVARPSRADWWQVGVIAMIVGIHSFYWFSGGPDFGARYWFLIIVACAALTARALVRLDEVLPGPGARGTTTGLALVVVAWLSFVPWRAADKYFHYRGMHPGMRTLAETAAFGRSIVFVRGKRHPDYASAAAYNPLDLTADTTLYAWDASPEARAEALRVYGDRPVYFVDGPTVTGGDFRVVAGPLDGAAAARYPRR